MKSALGHLKVLDLTRILAGPWATQNLADMGAEVIKIERPGVGDDTRAWGPPFLKERTARRPGDFVVFSERQPRQAVGDRRHRDARGPGDHPRAGRGRPTWWSRTTRSATLARYGLAYEDLRKINPRLVYCSVTGFGQDGPYAQLPGYDFVFQGMGGLMSITGEPDGEPGGGPHEESASPSADLLTGMYATTAILAALEHRHISGEGQYIDMSLLDCMVTINSYQAINYFLSGNIPQRMGNAHSEHGSLPGVPVPEGDIIIAVGNDGAVRRLLPRDRPRRISPPIRALPPARSAIAIART